MTVRNAYVLYLDNSYIWPGGDYDLAQMFAAEDLTGDVRAVLGQVDAKVPELLEMLGAAEPTASIGKHCDRPYSCDFYGHCHAGLPDPPITGLARVTESVLSALIAAGHMGVRDVPDDFPGLSAAQRAICRLVREGTPGIEGDLASKLAELRYPLHFVDFETFMPPLPIYPDTHVYHVSQFQWSDHVIHADGQMEHREFLHTDRSDPRRAFIEALLAATQDAGTILIYSSYEHTQLRALALQFPEHSAAIAAVQARLFDLEKVVKEHVRHPALLGRTSIKAVLPALVPDLTYDGLPIGNGDQAQRLYFQFMTGDLAPDQHANLFASLRQYCQLDTMAMVRVWQVLQEAAEGRGALGTG
ncbi:MAG: DUF2779 domain-containing protein [Vicinamibacterales bacterium]